jgi:PAS domain S-box-containing protein
MEASGYLETSFVNGQPTGPEPRFRALATSAPVGIYELDRSGDCLFVNDYWCELAGVEAEAALGRGWEDVIHSDDLPSVIAEWESAFERGREFALEYRYLRADGEVVWVSGRAVAIRDAEDEVLAYLGMVVDITERVAAERAARELAAIVESSADAIVGAGLDGIVRTWNPGAERIYGYRAEEMIGRSIEVLVPPGQPSELSEIYARIRAGERIEHHETTGMRKDWRRIKVAMTISPIRDDHGTVIGVSTIARDITGQKVAERRLAESSRHFELSHDLVATCDFDGYFKQLNGAWETTLGWAHADLLPTPLIEIVHPDDRSAVQDEIASLARGESVAELRARVATKRGGWRWIEWSAMPEPEVGLFYASGRDITERVDADLARRRERQQLAAAQEIASIGSFEIDLATGERRWSAQQFRNLGFEPGGSPPPARQIRERVHPDDRDEFEARLAELSAEGGETEVEYRVVTPGGETRTIESRARIVVDADGSRRIMGVSRDVTVERDAERLKEEFFSLISHELRTPLTSIIGYAELLAEVEGSNLSEQGKRFLEVIDRNSRRELHLVGDLLLLTRITAGKFEIEIGRADLSEIATATVEAARPMAESAGIGLALTAPADAVAEGDPHRLRQVLENLVSNAIKFTPAGGRVEVEVEVAGDRVGFRVTDTGIGIAEADLGRLFDRMYRAPEAERRHVQGTGLGLTIVKAIVDAHEAAIELESAPGEGTTFRVGMLRRVRTGPRGEREASRRRQRSGRPAGEEVTERG